MLSAKATTVCVINRCPDRTIYTPLVSFEAQIVKLLPSGIAITKLKAKFKIHKNRKTTDLKHVLR